MKKFSLMVLALVIVMVLSTACGQTPETPPTSAEPTVIRLGMTINEQDSFYVCATKFAELVEERTNGAYDIQLFPNSSLGDERTMLESMQMGTLDSGIITSGPFVNFVPEFGVLDLPFLFPDNASAYKVLDGEIGKEILSKLEDHDLKGLAYAERGFRNLTNSVRPVQVAGYYRKHWPVGTISDTPGCDTASDNAHRRQELRLNCNHSTISGCGHPLYSKVD